MSEIWKSLEHDFLKNPTFRNLFPDLSVDKNEIEKFAGTMSEDMEVEEHDLLENTTLRNLFPNLSVDKNEIEKFAELEQNTINAACVQKIALDVKIEEIQSDDDVEELDNSESIDIPTNCTGQRSCFFSNRIILGSKPNKSVDYETFFKQYIDRKRAFNVSVALSDIDPYLQMTNRFCKHCLMLFPNKSSLNVHIQDYHPGNDSRLPRNPRILNNSKVKCKKNGIVFKISKQNKLNSRLKIQSQRFARKKSDSRNKKISVGNRLCFHCNKFFTLLHYKEHIYQCSKNIPELKKCVVVLNKVESKDEHLKNYKSQFKNNNIPAVKTKLIKNKSKPLLTIHNVTTFVNDDQIRVTNVRKRKHKLIPNAMANEHDFELGVAKELETSVKDFELSEEDFVPSEEDFVPSEEDFVLSEEDFVPCDEDIDPSDKYLQPSKKKRKPFNEDCELSNENIEINHKNNISAHNSTTGQLKPEYVYQCPLCPLLYKTPKMLYIHSIKIHGTLLSAKHFVKSVFESECRYCPRKYDTVANSIEHSFRHHIDLIYKSRISTKGSYNSNRKILYRCGACSYYFTNKFSCFTHMTRKHHVYHDLVEEAYFDPACKYCSVKCQTRFLYNEHLVLVHKKHINMKHDYQSSDLDTVFTVNKESTINVHQQKNSQASLEGDIYKCFICSFYSQTEYQYQSHLSVKHGITKSENNRKVIDKSNFNPVCKYCQISSLTPSQYNIHLINNHGSYVNDKFTESSLYDTTVKKYSTTSQQENDLTSNDNTINEKIFCNLKVYKCYVCSCYYYLSLRLLQHLCQSHGFTKEISVDSFATTNYDPKCRNCSLTFSSPLDMNAHVAYFHRELFKRKIGQAKSSQAVIREPTEGVSSEVTNVISTNESSQPSFILKTAIFQCLKCDIHFLSPDVAKNHADHPEMLINWKCPICKFIFKDFDKILHEKQHTYSQNFTVHGINPDDLSSILYTCLKCNVHFDKTILLDHITSCTNDTPNFSYCKWCNIQIDSSISKTHENSHDKDNLKASDFIIVKSDAVRITETNVNNADKASQDNSIAVNGKNMGIMKACEKIPRREIHNECYLRFNYCNTCKSYVHNSKSKLHILQMCESMQKQYCRICGLTFSSKNTALNHKRLHSVREDLNLNHFTFYDHNEHVIAPPVPEYRKCNKCQVNFINRKVFMFHVCYKADYRKCFKCGNKYESETFDLHMNFHNYCHDGDDNCSALKVPQNESEGSRKLLNLYSIEGILYTCKNCCIAVDTYDKMVEHCQMHFTREENDMNSTQCTICNIEIYTSCFEKHKSLHSIYEDVSCFTILHFDPFYFTSPNEVWIQHVLGNLQTEQRNKIIYESIYRYECRVKMEIIQNGSPTLTVYKCDRCDTIINTSQLFKHAETSCFKIRKHACLVCGLPFHSCAARLEHEKVHSTPEISSDSFRIVSFNKEQDKKSNRILFSCCQYFVLYQCRNCAVVTDKLNIKDHKCNNQHHLERCYECDLMVSEKDYDTHIARHEDISNFSQTNIKLILFGEGPQGPQNINNTSFLGTVKDYTLYRCSKCQLCVIMKDRLLLHKCSSNAAKVKCIVCECYLSDNSNLKKHLRKHETDMDFVKENIRIIDVDTKSKEDKNTEDSVSSKEGTGVLTGQGNNFEKCVESSTNKKSLTPVSEYEQNDDVKTMETAYVVADTQSHTDDFNKRLRQMGKDIPGSVNEDCQNKTDKNGMSISSPGISIVGETTTQIIGTNLNGRNEKSNPSPTKDPNSSNCYKTVARIYKCICGLHFLDQTSILKHGEVCIKTKNIKIPKGKCLKCNLLFTFNVLFNHMLKHHNKSKGNAKLHIIDTAKENTAVYKCANCKYVEICEGKSDNIKCPKCMSTWVSSPFQSSY